MLKKAGFFLKIYFGFWLTIVIVAGVFIYTERLMTTEPVIRHWQRTVDSIVSFHAREASFIFDRNGGRSLQNYLRRLEKATGMRAFLFDAEGVEVNGEIVQRDIQAQVLSALRSDGATLIRAKESEIITQKVKGPKGHDYLFVALLPRPKPPEFLPPPGPPVPAMNHPPKPLLPPGTLSPPKPPPNGLHTNFLIRLLVGLIISAVICYLLARYLTGPVFKLSSAAKQLADGDLSVRVKPELKGRRDELSSLAGDFDVMAERLETLVTSQRNLLRDVSHELRSPLARLNVALELCRKHSGETAQKHLDRMTLEIQRLNELIGQILTYNKMNSQTMEVPATLLDLSRLIKEIITDANYETGGSRAVIRVNESILLEGSTELLRRAIENIVRNSLHHTPEHSIIEIFSKAVIIEGGPCAYVLIRDHGSGVPSDALPLIFKPFFKIAADRERASGAGLGLAISEAAVRLHHGTISAKNAEDGGLVMEIILPAKPVPEGHPMDGRLA